MAQDKEKNIELLTRRIVKNQQLLTNWITNGISQRKIDRLEAKIASDELLKEELEAL
jgi:hypothetical protein